MLLLATLCLFSVTNSRAQNLLVLHTQFGLSNRIRAIISGYDQGKKAGREVLVIWEKDVHVDCEFERLFETTLTGLSFTDKFNHDEYTAENYDVYDYMDADKYKRIDFSSPRNIYVKSAYRLNSPLWKVQDENELMKRLVPNPISNAMILNVKRRMGDGKVLGVHIRNVDPLVEIPDLPRHQYTSEGLASLKKYRSACNVSSFAKAINNSISQEGFTALFVTSDNPESVDRLQLRVQVPLSSLDKHGCYDRSCACVRYAIADLWLLGSTQYIIGSYWSSYTEMAGVFAGIQPLYLGKD